MEKLHPPLFLVVIHPLKGIASFYTYGLDSYATYTFKELQRSSDEASSVMDIMNIIQSLQQGALPS